MDNPVMTTLGDVLRQYISEQDKQVALAHRWLELWRARFPRKKAWSPDTIESHLSRTLKNDPQGIRFFFDNPPRTDLLLEVLGVPADEHARLRTLAADARQPGPRLVVDISAWPVRGEALDALFTELRQKVLRDSPLKPVALVLSEEQYERLPRSYDEQINHKFLSIHKVASATEGRTQVAELADDAALVLAAWQFQPLERWLAAEFAKATLSLEPGDALAVFAEHGALPSLSAVEHPLDAICEPAEVTFQEFTALQRRIWLYTLASEARTTAALERHEDLQDPAQRLAFARQLGAVATSTERERLDHELDQLATRLGEALHVAVDRLDPAAHADRLARAELRPTPLAAWRCGDTIHLLNGDSPIDHPRIVVHRPAPAVPALTRLLAHISGWTEDDHEADPSLARAIEALDPQGNERPAFLHARATLLWNDLRPAPRQGASFERWAEGLRELLAGDPPPASLRVRLPPSDPKLANGQWLAFADDAHLTSSFESPPSLLSWPRGRRTILVDRGREVYILSGSIHARQCHIDASNDRFVTFKDARYYGSVNVFGETKDGSYLNSIPDLWLPKLSRPSLDVDAWLDAVERSSSLHGWKWQHSARCEKLLRTTGRSQIDLIIGERELDSAPVTLAPRIWQEGDLLLAQCWLALRLALERPLAVRLATGVVCSLGGGVCAHLAVHERDGAPSRGTIAAFGATIATNPLGTTYSAAIDFTSLWTHSAVVENHAASFGLHVPANLVLRAPTFSATVTFLASPLLQASTPAAIGTLAATVAARIADEEAQQAAYDDDD
ncbi:hypothetical protein [Nannocystis radixulma]|uniref:Uncharacterized protein n=1 Tax=Nannocystis radixulma TaxID=2995305 RepID=A0ABT5B1R4_9BACT|nr:hypothetical protein [Nannocystis radixulma]MDC0668045.1 hypothetical protein [Nannocystis radixulma]